MSKHLFIALGLLLIATLSLHAQQRRFTVVAPYGGKELKELGFLDEDGEFQKLKWSRSRRSPEYTAPRTNDVRLVKPHVNEEGRTEYLPVLDLNWPGNTNQALFVVVQVDGETPARVMAIDDRDETFPLNTLKVLNGIDQTIYALAGDKKFQLNAGKLSKAFTTEKYFQVDEDAPNPGMPIAVGVNVDGQYDLLYAAGVSVTPHSRVLCLVLPPKQQGSTRYQARLLIH
ncbi:hypothetical protein [Cerasicoccus frondis]|uniref:hypothetical protein n=1 Tax=Cerasicoccus frondis TaxID=490090 RepID=UPI002852B4EE|nr:hypothetical protein [Cerasicoccus frondis]